MEDLTCPNCNVDADKEELRRSNGLCPTCGFDMSGAEEEEEDWDDEELEDEDEEDDEDEDEDEDEEEED